MEAAACPLGVGRRFLRFLTGRIRPMTMGGEARKPSLRGASRAGGVVGRSPDG